jgi:hypothetical protein
VALLLSILLAVSCAVYCKRLRSVRFEFSTVLKLKQFFLMAAQLACYHVTHSIIFYSYVAFR